MLSPTFAELVKQLQVLPGVGQKSAQRMALHLLNKKRPEGLALAAALDSAMHHIKSCQRCFGLSDDEICPICLDSRRDERQLCVVEQASDVVAIEQSGQYRGRYFVLGGHLSPLDGISAQDLHMAALAERLHKGSIDELILATGATAEGQTTAYFIYDIAKDAVPTITRLAQGIPMGGELGYVDGVTLSQALQYRVGF